MKILQINGFGNLSTGRIATDIHRTLTACGENGKVVFARNDIASDVPFFKIGSALDVKIHALMTRLTDRTGFFSKGATKKLLKEIDAYQPDIVHLHNIHGYYLHIELLFEYLKRKKIPVVWTLHDCWAFTGHCCYFSAENCKKWKTGCFDCPQKSAYPRSFFIDSSGWNYQKKKEIFSGVNMQLVAVSEWLKTLVGQSFLKNYSIRTIHNGIDLSVFRPTESNFRKRYGLSDKIIVLGVAGRWDVRKGLKDFFDLSAVLDDRFQIVLVGLNRKEQASLPKNILGLGRVDDVRKLAEFYTAADLFFNPSVEETFGLSTVEALACGTPVVAYNTTAMPEIIDDSYGFIIEPHDLQAVKQILTEKKYLAIEKQACLRAAQNYEKNNQYEKYVKLYREILNSQC